MFSRMDEVGWAQSTAFKKTFSMDVDIEFIGVWDTVSSVGLVPRHLPFITSNTAIKTFRHAVSLDERRAKFKANLYHRPTNDELKLGVQPGEMPKSTSNSNINQLCALSGPDTVIKADVNSRKWQSEMESRFSQLDDIGGGSVPTDTRHTLARIPLRWMIRQCFLTGTGIQFHTDLLRTVGLNPATLYPFVQPRPPPVISMTQNDDVDATPKLVRTNVQDGMAHTSVDTSSHKLTEEEEDYQDALSPMYDQLSLSMGWWLLEVLPVTDRVQKHDNSWESAMA
ncbi:hypothetical protein EIP86_002044 [Pleurotus ostreatoroseus]|nr:hypothetical protein EIP86_002044 [Pleurotus ostreatoroseus]